MRMICIGGISGDLRMDKTYEFVVNTHSRTGKAEMIWAQLEQVLAEAQVSYRVHITQYEHHATEIAAELTSSEEDVYLVVAGGDGTVNEVLNGIRDFSKVTFGYLPLGSANDFARGLGLTAEPEQILRAILSSTAEDVIDVGEVVCADMTRRFAISAGAGIDAAVCREALTSKLKVFLNRLHLGSLTYGLLTVIELFRAPFVTGQVTLDGGRRLEMKKSIFVAAMNFRCEGGGVPMAPHASATDGQLSACCVYGIPRLLCLFCFPFLIAGRHEGIRGFDVINTSQMHVVFDRPMVVHADGEDCGDQTDVTFRCIPGALHMPHLDLDVATR